MNKYFTIIIILVVSFGCSNDDDKTQIIDPNTVDLHNIKGTRTSTSVEVSIKTTAGEKITEVEALRPNTEYDITMKGNADFLRISNGHIFEVLKVPDYKSSTDEFTYRIKTGSDFADRILINVVPLHKKENGFVRERTQVIFLPY